METTEPTKVEIKEMPSKKLLEAFISQMVLGKEVTVRFNTEEGIFEQSGG